MFTDPFGLMECPPDCENESKVNWLKMVVGTANVVRGSRSVATGATGMVFSAGRGKPGGVVLGAVHVAFGLSTASRGERQMQEANNDPNGPAWKNLWGALPFGQRFDDPGEPSPAGYFIDLIGKTFADPINNAKAWVIDFFALEKETKK